MSSPQEKSPAILEPFADPTRDPATDLDTGAEARQLDSGNKKGKQKKGKKGGEKLSDTDVPQQKRKAGNQGNFHGKQLEFLELWFEKHSTTDKKKGAFWKNFFKAWWSLFPWAWKGTGDASSTLAAGSADTAGASTTTDAIESLQRSSEKLSPEEQKAKTAFIAQLKWWFSNQQMQDNRINKNPFAEWFSQLSKYHRLPCRKEEYKVYMSMEHYAEKVAAVYEKEYGTVEGGKDIGVEEQE
ncbi:hypothetical protein C8J56DRAFT_1045625 [Mycena floridula]|nr:hypothetical protein C8J56DRAFT_1045625 [Mycena floridula]